MFCCFSTGLGDNNGADSQGLGDGDVLGKNGINGKLKKCTNN